jgi:hypothetical protein
MKNAKLLWAEDKIPEVPVAIDIELLDSLVRSRKFRSWKPESPSQVDTSTRRRKNLRNSLNDRQPSQTTGPVGERPIVSVRLRQCGESRQTWFGTCFVNNPAY